MHRGIKKWTPKFQKRKTEIKNYSKGEKGQLKKGVLMKGTGILTGVGGERMKIDSRGRFRTNKRSKSGGKISTGKAKLTGVGPPQKAGGLCATTH